MDVFFTHFDEILKGYWVSLYIGLMGFAGAMFIGATIAAFRISPIRPLAIFGATYVEVFRNIPLLSLLLLVILGLPYAGLTLPIQVGFAVSLMVFGGAFAAEAIRSGINGIPAGQIEAARSVGLTFSQVLKLVVLPQAGRSMIGPIVNVFIGMFMATSLGQSVGVYDMTSATYNLQNQYVGGVGLFMMTAFFYAATNLGIAALGHRVARKVAVQR